MRTLKSTLLSLLTAALCACAQVPANRAPSELPVPQVPAAPETQLTSPTGAQLAGAATEPVAAAQVVPIPLPGSGGPETAPANAPAPVSEPPVPVALLLPGSNTPFARAAEAVRLGFFAAQAVSGANVAVQLLEIDDNVGQLRNAFATALRHGARMVVGPLTRSMVNALGDGRVVAPMPVVTLNLPESETALGADVLAFGVSVEAEARQLAYLAMANLSSQSYSSGSRFLILAGESPLQRRVAGAFRDALRERGESATQIDVRVGYTILQTLAEQLAALKVEAVLCALDARETAFVRPRLPRELPIYATSQVNLGGAEAELLAPDLEGVRFVDMPWLLEPEHAAVMVYPRSELALSGELRRLYALGIDGFRLMLEWLAGRREFELDGVTGRLRVDRARSARVERIATPAVFHSGKIERLEPTQ